MREERIQADVVIIGAGIAGLSLAHRAGWYGLRPIVLDDGREGTTYAATGIIAPRADYMLRDIDLVRFSDRECERFKAAFPAQIRPTRFFVPIDPTRRRMFDNMKELFRQYDEITPKRRKFVPSSSVITQKQLEKEEPNINRRKFNGALVLWELTADPRSILQELERLNRGFLTFYRRINIGSADIDLVALSDEIHEIVVESNDFKVIIEAGTTPMVVVNAAGPWIQDVVAPFGINLDIEMRLGIQASVSGNLLGSGVITFDQNGLYCICLPRDGYTQVGPTNTQFHEHPDNLSGHKEGYEDLIAGFRSALKPNIPVGECKFLRSGLRVKPKFGDTNRPVIWSHRENGLNNFYTLFPGKMSLGFLAADELLRVYARDTNNSYLASKVGAPRGCALEGNLVSRNKVFLAAERLKSLAKVGWNILKI